MLPLAHVTGTITRLGSAACAATLRLDAVGRTPPPANAVSTVGIVGAIAVRLNATALTPDPGTGLPMTAHGECERRGRADGRKPVHVAAVDGNARAGRARVADAQRRRRRVQPGRPRRHVALDVEDDVDRAEVVEDIDLPRSAHSDLHKVREHRSGCRIEIRRARPVRDPILEDGQERALRSAPPR